MERTVQRALEAIERELEEAYREFMATGRGGERVSALQAQYWRYRVFSRRGRVPAQGARAA